MGVEEKVAEEKVEETVTEEAGEQNAEGQESQESQEVTTETTPVEEPAHEETVPYDRFKESREEVNDLKRRLEQTEGALRQIAERPVPAVDTHVLEEQFDNDRVGTISRLAAYEAANIIRCERDKTNAVEDIAEEDPEYAKHKREVRRAVDEYRPIDKKDLENFTRLQYEAAIGRRAKEIAMKAHEKGRKQAIEGKRVAPHGTATSTTTSKSTSKISDKEMEFHQHFGITADRIKEQTKRGHVIEG